LGVAEDVRMAKVYKVKGEWRVRFDDGSGHRREYVIPVG
jgi:hypothetical protein